MNQQPPTSPVSDVSNKPLSEWDQEDVVAWFRSFGNVYEEFVPSFEQYGFGYWVVGLSCSLCSHYFSIIEV